jgi:hypothetical protein
MSQDRVQWRSLVKTIMNSRAPWKARNFLTSWESISFSRRTLLHRVKTFFIHTTYYFPVTKCLITFQFSVTSRLMKAVYKRKEFKRRKNARALIFSSQFRWNKEIWNYISWFIIFQHRWLCISCQSNCVPFVATAITVTETIKFAGNDSQLTHTGLQQKPVGASFRGTRPTPEVFNLTRAGWNRGKARQY